MIAIALKRPVTISMFVAALIVFGVISYLELGRDLLPEIAFPSLTVMTRYEGAAPQEVEEFITKRLESALATVKGKRRLSSISREGLSLITIQFEWGHDMQIATLHVREKLDVARFQTNYPQDADRPNILRWDPSAKPILGLAITGDTTMLQLKETVRELVKPRFEQLDGIAFAQISGDIERVIDIEIDRQKLSLYNISLQTVADAVKRANANVAGGTIKKGRYRYALRTLGEFNSVHEMNGVIVARKNGAAIRIADIATVRDTTKDRQAMATVNQKEAIGLLVYKEAGANTIEATKLAKELLRELDGNVSGLTLTLAFEEAQFIEQALNNVWVSLIFGGFFAFLVLVLFLRDLKSPFFIFVSIPIAIIATLVLMHFSGLSLNLMSLGGLALGVGMLVDNSIVVLENIYRHRERDHTPLRAAFRGAREVAQPVAASTFTTISVFFPIVYLEGVAGELFGEQALTVTYSLLSSLVVSLTVLPLLTSLTSIVQGRDSLPAKTKPLPQLEASSYPRSLFFWKWWEFPIAALSLFFVAAYFKMSWSDSLWIVAGVAVLPLLLFCVKHFVTFVLSWMIQATFFLFWLVKTGVQVVLDALLLPVFDFLYGSFERAYHVALKWCLERKVLALSIAILLTVISVKTAANLKKELMPKSATGQFSIDVKLAQGTALEITAQVIQNLETFLLEDEAVEIVFSQIGASDANLSQLLEDSGTNTAIVSVKLKDSWVSLDQVLRISENVRAFLRPIPDAQVSFSESESALEDLLSSEGGGGLIVRIEGQNLEDLYQAGVLVQDALRALPILKDVKCSLTRDYPQIQVQLNRKTIDLYGFQVSEVGSFLAGGMRGEAATKFKEFDRTTDVRVRFAKQDRENFERVLESVLYSPTGTPVQLAELIHVDLVKGTKEIRRMNQKRVAMVTANLAGLKISEAMPTVTETLSGIVLPANVSRPHVDGEQEGIRKSFSQLLFAFVLSALLVYMIMAGQFESLRFPFVVIFTVPMGWIGTVLMLYTFDQSVNIMSLIGLIVLSGIVVNDAIVKVDFINQARARGASVREAILEASRARLRPILMTTATTVLGLAPMAWAFIPSLLSSTLVKPMVAFCDARLTQLGWVALSDLFSTRGAEIQRPLALVIMGGLSLATLLTLLLVPVLYELIAGKDRVMGVQAKPSDTPNETVS